MKPTFLKTFIAAAVLLFVAAAPGWSTSIDVAPTVVLSSSVGGVWDYSLDFPGSDDFTFPLGSTISFTGMSGVTGTSVSSTLSAAELTTDGFTSASATFGFLSYGAEFINGTSVDWVVGTMVIDSSAAPGTIDWNITLAAPGGDPGGTVAGPVGAVATPEPTSLVLMLCGFAGLALLAGLTRRAQQAAATVACG